MVIALMLVPGPGLGQTRGPAESGADPGRSLQVSLVTVGPGPSVSSQFGHGFLRVRDARGAYDRTYSFGRSGLDGPVALASLIQGRLPAGGGRVEADTLLRRYADEGRSIWIQELALHPEQQRELTRFLEDGGGVGSRSLAEPGRSESDSLAWSSWPSGHSPTK